MRAFAGRPVPIASFASVMGIAGFGLAWRVAVKAASLPPELGEWLIALAAVLFGVLLVVEPFNVGMWGYTFPAAATCDALAAITLTVAIITVFACAAWVVRGWIRQLTRAAGLQAT